MLYHVFEVGVVDAKQLEAMGAVNIVDNTHGRFATDVGWFAPHGVGRYLFLRYNPNYDSRDINHAFNLRNGVEFHTVADSSIVDNTITAQDGCKFRLFPTRFYILTFKELAYYLTGRPFICDTDRLCLLDDPSLVTVAVHDHDSIGHISPTSPDFYLNISFKRLCGMFDRAQMARCTTLDYEICKKMLQSVKFSATIESTSACSDVNHFTCVAAAIMQYCRESHSTGIRNAVRIDDAVYIDDTVCPVHTDLLEMIQKGCTEAVTMLAIDILTWNRDFEFQYKGSYIDMLVKDSGATELTHIGRLCKNRNSVIDSTIVDWIERNTCNYGGDTAFSESNTRYAKLIAYLAADVFDGIVVVSDSGFTGVRVNGIVYSIAGDLCMKDIHEDADGLTGRTRKILNYLRDHEDLSKISHAMSYIGVVSQTIDFIEADAELMNL